MASAVLKTPEHDALAEVQMRTGRKQHGLATLLDLRRNFDRADPNG